MSLQPLVEKEISGNPPSGVLAENTQSRRIDGGSGSKLSFEERSAQLVDQYLEASQNSKLTGSLLPITKALIEQLADIVYQEPQKNLLSVIKSAGSGLTSESDPTRASANRLLAELMSPLVESKILTKNQVHFLVQFFIEKLDDGPTIVIEAINGLKYLSRSSHFQAEQVVNCCKALFQNVTTSDFEQPKRLVILALIDNLMAFHRDALKGMGSNFLAGYCSLVEGEKDPRNLIVAFKLAKVILTEFELGDQAESMFDITFCYFPITFRPPPGNPDAYGGITAEELIQGLIGCLSATPQFGIFVLPLLLEKFQAPGFGPKAQVLETVIQAFPTYGQATVAEFAPLFWECFLVEIFQPNASPSKEFLALMEHACQTLFKTIFPLDADFSPSGPIDFMKQALEVVIKELHSPEKSRAIPATRLVCWIIESGANTTDVILPTITTSVGTLLQLWIEILTVKGDDNLKKQTAILAHLSSIFRSIATVTSAHISVAAFQGETWLTTTIKQEILSMLLTEVTRNKQSEDSPTQVAALWTLVQFVNIPNTIDLPEARKVIDTVTQLLGAGQNDEMINAGIECLSILADSHPTGVASITIPELFGKLPTPNPDSTPSFPKYLHILECLAALCHREALFNTFLVRLLDAFALFCRAAFQASMNELICEDKNHFDQHAYGHHLLLSLYATLESLAESSQNDIKKPRLDLEQTPMVQTQARFIIGRLFEILLYEDHTLDLVPIMEMENQKIAAKLGQDFDERSVCKHCSIRNNVQILVDAGRIINLLVRQLDFEQQQELATELHDGYQLGKMEELIEKLQNISALAASSTSQTRRPKISFNPMGIDSSDADKNMMILYSEALIAIRPGIEVLGEVLSTQDFFPFRHYKQLCKTKSTNLVAFQAGLRYLCSTVNRRAEDFPEFFGQQLSQFWNSEISLDQSNSLQSRKLALEIWLSIIKGLIVRVDSRGYELLDRVSSLLKEKKFGWWVAKRLSVVVDPKDETLSTKNFAVIKFLWMQRVCHYLITCLVQGAHQSNGDTRSVYLAGLATSLARLGPSLVSLQQEKVIPLLLEAMNLNDLDVKLDSLSTIHDFIINKSSLTLEKHLSTLVSALLLNCTFGRIPIGQNQKDLNTPQSPDPSPGVDSSSIRLLALKVLSILPVKIGDGTPADSKVEKTASKGVLYGERSRVLKVLKNALDDPKRAVRKMAVDCRAHWFSFNAT